MTKAKYSVLKRVTITTAIGIGAMAAVLAMPLNIGGNGAGKFRPSQIELERKVHTDGSIKKEREISEALAEEREARKAIADILDAEGIKYTENNSEIPEDYDFVIHSKKGVITIEYGNQIEVQNPDYEKRIQANFELAEYGQNPEFDYHYIPGPVGYAKHFIENKGIARMIKEKLK